MIDIFMASLAGDFPEKRWVLRQMAMRIAGELRDCAYFSYSENAAFCAISQNMAIGFDAEAIAVNSKEHLGKFLRRCFPKSASHFGKLGMSGLIRAWTVLEALAKLANTGITGKFLQNINKYPLYLRQVRPYGNAPGWQTMAFYGHYLCVAFYQPEPVQLKIISPAFFR